MSNLAKIIDRKKDSFLITKKFLQIILNKKIKTLILQDPIENLYDLTKEQLNLINNNHRELFFNRLIGEFKKNQPEEKNKVYINTEIIQSIVKIGKTQFFERYLQVIMVDKHYTMYDILQLSQILEKTKNKDIISDFYRQIQPLLFNYDENIKKSMFPHPLFTHDPYLKIKPEAHKDCGAREEYSRHCLIFNSLEYLNQDNIIEQWEDLSPLEYTIRENALFGCKSEFFWMLKVNERFPEVYDKIFNSEKNRYLLCSTSYTENIAESPQHILFMHYDFKDINKSLTYVKDLNLLFTIKQSQEGYEHRSKPEDLDYLQYEFFMLKHMNKNLEQSELPNFIVSMIETTTTINKNFSDYIPVDNILEKDNLILDRSFFIDSIKLYENKDLLLINKESNIKGILQQWGNHLSPESLNPLISYLKKYNYSMNEAFSEKGVAFSHCNLSREEKKQIAETLYKHTHNFQFIAQLVKYGKSKSMSELDDKGINEHFNSIISVNIELGIKHNRFPRNTFLKGILEAMSYYENKKEQIEALHQIINEFNIDPKITHMYLKNLIKRQPSAKAFMEVDADIQKNYLNKHIKNNENKKPLIHRL